MFSFLGAPAARRHICQAALAYCRLREPAVVLLGRVGAARGRRPDRDPRRTRPGGAGRVRERIAARLSVVVDRLWRAEALAEMIAEAGLQPEIARTDENTPLVRTAVDPRLVHIAARLDPRRGQDRAAAVAARTPRTAGLDAGGRHARGRPVPAGPGPARPRHAFAARVGDDAGRDSPDADRHQRARIRRCGSAGADGYRAW